MPDNRKPLIYGAFPVCRNYTVRAYVRHAGTPEWGGHQDCVRYAGTFLSRVHAGYLRPCDNGGATTGGGDHGCRAGGIAENYFYQNRGLGIPKPRFDVSHSGFIPVWVTVWVKMLLARNGLQHLVAEGFQRGNIRNSSFSDNVPAHTSVVVGDQIPHPFHWTPLNQVRGCLAEFR